MRLYVCWGTFPVPWPRRGRPWRPSEHPCKAAHDALRAAGHAPKVTRAYGFAFLPDFTRARRKVKQLTGESFVPVLVLDDETVIAGSHEIEAWALEHPAAGLMASERVEIQPSVPEWEERSEVYREIVAKLREHGHEAEIAEHPIRPTGGDLGDLPLVAQVAIAGFAAGVAESIGKKIADRIAAGARLRWTEGRKGRIRVLYGPDGREMVEVRVDGEPDD